MAGERVQFAFSGCCKGQTARAGWIVTHVCTVCVEDDSTVDVSDTMLWDTHCLISSHAATIMIGCSALKAN